MGAGLGGGPLTGGPVNILAPGAEGTSLILRPTPGMGLSFTDPVFEIRTSALNQTFLFQFGSGRTASTWEFAMGYYGAAGSPLIQVRNSLYLSTVAGGFLAPFSPAGTDLGILSNYWRGVYAETHHVLSNVGMQRVSGTINLYAAGTSGITETIRLISSRADAGLKCVTVGTEAVATANTVLLNVAHSITTAQTDAGNGTWMFRVDGSGNIRTGNGTPGLGVFYGASALQQRYMQIDDGNPLGWYDNAHRFQFSSAGVVYSGNGAVPKVQWSNEGLESRSGTDSTGTPGNATINKPSGISSVASGVATCTVTNSMIPAVATRRVKIQVTLNGDPGALVTKWWVTQTAGGGSFVMNFNGNAGSNTPFSWEVSENI